MQVGVSPCAVCRNSGLVDVKDGRQKLCLACGGASNPGLMDALAQEQEERQRRERAERRAGQDAARVRRKARKRERAARRRSRT
ncbi:MAG: hypothetical protein A2V88_12855 [Elusimicrobia bacterium RBG_16_66_12]|nr:MAG: hypothetical protein A2V88_12855 [Elusimicrobia bacterium RBG_16_66_12]